VKSASVTSGRTQDIINRSTLTSKLYETEMYHRNMKQQKQQHRLRLKTVTERTYVHAFPHIFHTQLVLSDILYIASSCQRFDRAPCKFTSHNFIRR